MPLFRLLSALTVVAVAVILVITHLPAWALKTLGCAWLIVLLAAAVDALREMQRGRAAASERERLRLLRS